MAQFISGPVGTIRGSERPGWMPNPTNNFNDLNAVILLLRAIPRREGGKNEAWEDPTKLPSISLSGERFVQRIWPTRLRTFRCSGGIGARFRSS